MSAHPPSAARRPRHATAVGVMIGSVVLVTAACSGSTGSTSSTAGSAEASSAGPVRIAAVIKGLDNPFFQTMQAGIDDQSKTAGVTTTVQAAQSITDTTGQADKLTALAGQDYSCYIVNPISGTNLVQGVARLAAAKKTIVNIDNPIDEAAATAAKATPATYIGTDNVSAGELGGKHLASVLPAGSEVAMVGGISGDVTSAARLKGFEQGIGSGHKVVQTVAGNWDRQEALTQATNVLRAHPNVRGIFSANDDMALGIARAVANAGKTGQVKIVSVDGIKDALNAVKSGELEAVVAQYPYAIGLMGIEACQAAAKGATLPAKVTAPVELVTKDVADKALAATPKPFGSFDDPLAKLLAG